MNGWPLSGSETLIAIFTGQHYFYASTTNIMLFDDPADCPSIRLLSDC